MTLLKEKILNDFEKLPLHLKEIVIEKLEKMYIKNKNIMEDDKNGK